MGTIYYTESFYFPSENKDIEYKIPVYMPTIGEEECFLENISCAKHKDLPMNLFISQKRGNHGGGPPRIKFQLDRSTNYNANNSLFMTIEDNPMIKDKNGKILRIGVDKMGKLKPKDLYYLIAFIKNIDNRKILNDLWYGRENNLKEVEKKLNFDITKDELNDVKNNY